ncbi:MAG TPA: ATP-binding protein [Anaerolineales bacterium]|nr:ATP-binding protein [Anaerolineales bacterium]
MTIPSTLPPFLADTLFESILSITPAAIITVDETQKILLFNRGAEAIFGYSKEEMLNQSLDRLLPVSSTDVHRQHLRAFAQTPERMRLMSARQQVWGRRKDGQLFPAEAAISKVHEAGSWFFTVLLQDISVRFQLEEALRKYRTHLERLQETRATHGEGIDSLLEELQTQGQAQEALTQKANSLARTNQELTQFASVMAHDLQAPLRTLTYFLETGTRAYQMGETEKGEAIFVQAQETASRMKTLIHHLLVATQRRDILPDFEPVSLNGLLAEVLENLKLAIQENAVRITNDPLPALSVDKHQIIQLLQNLINNAIQFRSEQTPHIHISARKLPREETSPDIVPPTQWVFCVRDNGQGIAPHNLERIFEMNYRAEVTSPGQGMGLAIARRVVESHGGRIWVESEPGRGAKFYFTLFENS